ncbi:hypothetical protein HS088_TW08G00376 [Tripterygium wilfordii]|uniref:Uncharacterized protein n=1 Tax=Tripterygium wilfordii TaxID=458696 RepID=A0A7J7DC10_TRIWF|nr:hypothetical protein HS088_TW08G00376 [Tripterygium wilfordii]
MKQNIKGMWPEIARKFNLVAATTEKQKKKETENLIRMYEIPKAKQTNNGMESLTSFGQTQVRKERCKLEQKLRRLCHNIPSFLPSFLFNQVTTMAILVKSRK